MSDSGRDRLPFNAYTTSELVQFRRDLDERLKERGYAPKSVLPLHLNEKQEEEIRRWAADDRLWNTGETVIFNLRVFARVILAAEDK
jgi:hypothetical protein